MMTMLTCVCFLHASSVEVKICGKQAGSLRVEFTIFYEQGYTDVDFGECALLLLCCPISITI